MAKIVTPTLRVKVEHYVRNEHAEAGKYVNRRVLDSEGIAHLRTLVAEAYAAGYEDGYGAGWSDLWFTRDMECETRDTEAGEDR